MMPKTRDVPTELREFNSVFSMLCRKYEVNQIFSDFLSIVICCMAHGTQEKEYFEIIKRYEKNELNDFAKLLGELLIYYGKNTGEGTWCDPLGEFYEILAGNYKKSRLGQFFTPFSLCEIMAQLTISKGTWGKNINEPASGSGRTILALNAYAQGNYFVAQDLDPICAKMTAINMCFHKVRGEVYCMNTITQETPYFGYKINHEWHKHETMNILKIPQN